jgi:hypothetical protein
MESWEVLRVEDSTGHAGRKGLKQGFVETGIEARTETGESIFSTLEKRERGTATVVLAVLMDVVSNYQEQGVGENEAAHFVRRRGQR